MLSSILVDFNGSMLISTLFADRRRPVRISTGLCATDDKLNQ